MHKSKKAVSGIVTTILIILMALAAIVIIWNVVRGVIKSPSEEIDTGAFTVNLEINKQQSFLDVSEENPLNIFIQRNAGKGDITGIKFVLEDSTGKRGVLTKNIEIGELETKKIDISSEDLGALGLNLEIEYVEIYPVIKTSSGKEKIGPLQDSIREGEAGGTPGVTCGDGICDAREQANPALCADDCGKFKETVYYLDISPELGDLADMNNDGLLDVVVLTEKREKGKAPEGFVKIFYQMGDGTLRLSEEAYSIEHGADMINTGDINNDGLNDIVITTDDVSADVTAFLIQSPLNTFSLSFKSAPGLPTSAGSAEIGDINGDGLNDVVRGNKPRGSISIYYQNSDHNLEEPVEIFVGGKVERWRTSDGRIGDFNNDGKNDFAVRNGVLLNGNAFFTVFYNLGNNQFNIINYDTGVTSSMGLSDIRSADMDNDGLADVVISINEGDIGVYLQANGDLEGRIYPSGLHSIRGIALGDINGDGKKDIIASSFECSEGVSILLQDANGDFDEQIKLSSVNGFGGFVEVGDVNNDGNEEIVTTNGLTLQTSNCPEKSISVIELRRDILFG